jgi:hypothetical protein
LLLYLCEVESPLLLLLLLLPIGVLNLRFPERNRSDGCGCPLRVLMEARRAGRFDLVGRIVADFVGLGWLSCFWWTRAAVGC